MSKDKVSRVNIKYEKSPEYRTYGATGVYVGMSPNGEVVFDIFVERQSPPDTISAEIKEGRINETHPAQSDPTYVRERIAGICYATRYSPVYRNMVSKKSSNRN